MRLAHADCPNCQLAKHMRGAEAAGGEQALRLLLNNFVGPCEGPWCPQLGCPDDLMRKGPNRLQLHHLHSAGMCCASAYCSSHSDHTATSRANMAAQGSSALAAQLLKGPVTRGCHTFLPGVYWDRHQATLHR